MAEGSLPFVDLVYDLREAKFDLAPEQYAQFRQALKLGYGSASHEQLRQLCHLLWVKPSATYRCETFDRVFDAFLETHRSLPADTSQPENFTPPPQPNPVQPETPATPAEFKAGVLPTVPPGRFPDRTDSSATNATNKVPTAIASPPSSPTAPTRPTRYPLRPTRLPASDADVYRLWTQLKRPTRISRDLELDVEATIAKMEHQGADCDPVLRSRRSRRSTVVVFLDTNNNMIPYRPVVQPWLQSVTSGRITPAQVYRFTTVPVGVVYPWERPVEAEPIDRVLSLLHRQRTLAIILSDAGAASGLTNLDRIRQTNRFLEILAPCVQQIIWLNPVPADRWSQSSATYIHRFLGGRMYEMCPESAAAILSDRPRRFQPTAQRLGGIVR